VTAHRYEAADLLWYVAVTEWIVFSPRLVFREVEIDLREGRVTGALIRPLPYALTSFAGWLATTALRFAVLGPASAAFALALTGTWRLPLEHLLLLLVSSAAAIVALACFIFERGLRRYRSGNRMLDPD
jgi:ABC-type uncharacterized transport system permease subunit